jgi:hypothetical protein
MDDLIPGPYLVMASIRLVAFVEMKLAFPGALQVFIYMKMLRTECSRKVIHDK